MSNFKQKLNESEIMQELKSLETKFGPMSIKKLDDGIILKVKNRLTDVEIQRLAKYLYGFSNSTSTSEYMKLLKDKKEITLKNPIST